MRLLATLVLALLAAACARERWPAPSAPTVSPLQFFDGRSEGRGVLKIALRAPQDVSVESLGALGPDGILTLRQTIVQGTKAPRMREWRMREVSPGRYEGSLTDAVGPVAMQTSGNSLRLRFRMKDGLEAEQRLVFAPDGRSAENVMRIRKFGFVVARLDEKIRRLD